MTSIPKYYHLYTPRIHRNGAEYQQCTVRPDARRRSAAAAARGADLSPSGSYSRWGVVFVTGRGGAGFHLPGPALTRGRGGYF